MNAEQTVLVVDSNSAGNGARALMAARARGYRTHFLARAPQEYARRPLNPLLAADVVTEVDTFDVPKMLRVLTAARGYVAALAYDELRVVQAALLGDYVGAEHNPPVHAVVQARFKDLTRTALAGTPWSVSFATRSLKAPCPTSPIGYPCVVKPVDEAASVGVRICRDDRAFAEAIDQLRTLTAQLSSRGYQRTGEFLVEELLTGDEYSAELAWSSHDCDWRLIGFTEKTVSPEPECVETGHVFPHSFGAEDDQRIASALSRCLRRLGLRDTVVHVEFRIDHGRPRLVEVNPRPAGGPIPELVKAATGVCLTDLHLAAHLGNADKLLGSMQVTGIAAAGFLVAPGAASNEDRLGHVIVRGESAGQAKQALAKELARLRQEAGPG
jgi:hypothetical protein